MSLLLLVSDGGYAATTITLNSGATASGYDAKDLISGPRSTMWRSDSSSSNIAIGYEHGARSETHIVISRADLLLTQNGTRLRAMTMNIGGVWGLVSGIDYNPLTSADLMGPYGQDICIPFTPPDPWGTGIRCDPVSGSQAVQISKMIVSTSFTFGVEPHFLQSPPVWEPLPPTSGPTLFTPPKGFEPFEVEARITLVWEAVTTAKATQFKALAQILKWPLYLYDSTGDVFSWKLEHVVVQEYTEQLIGQGYRNISITFLRLKHYDV